MTLCPSVSLCVCLSVCHKPVLCQNGLTDLAAWFLAQRLDHLLGRFHTVFEGHSFISKNTDILFLPNLFSDRLTLKIFLHARRPRHVLSTVNRLATVARLPLALTSNVVYNALGVKQQLRLCEQFNQVLYVVRIV